MDSIIIISTHHIWWAFPYPSSGEALDGRPATPLEMTAYGIKWNCERPFQITDNETVSISTIVQGAV